MFYGYSISLQLSMLLWISIWISLDFYGCPCIDLLWILDPGTPTRNQRRYHFDLLKIDNPDF